MDNLDDGCGKQLWVADFNGYIPVCGVDGHLCDDCSYNHGKVKT